MKEERRDYWDKYPDISSDAKEIKREIKSINDISVDLSDIDWPKYPPVEQCTDMGDTNGNAMDDEILEIDDRSIYVSESQRNNSGN